MTTMPLTYSSIIISTFLGSEKNKIEKNIDNYYITFYYKQTKLKIFQKNSLFELRRRLNVLCLCIKKYLSFTTCFILYVKKNM